MKIIKKIAAIMLSVMMVLGMCSVVGAEGTSGTPATTGSITIKNAAPGETYNIYRILDLESYSGSGEAGNYAYKLRTYDSSTTATNNWNKFINGNDIKDVYVTLDGEYVTWKEGAKAEEFAKEALDYAKNSTINPDETMSLSDSETSATFTGIPLGYYLVETSVGTVLALDTTNPDKTIYDKNTAPTVEKEVSKTKDGNYEGTSTASIGDTVYFKTTIHAKKGAKDYVLHDTMSAGLTFDEKSIDVKKQGASISLSQGSDYILATDSIDCIAGGFKGNFRRDRSLSGDSGSEVREERQTGKSRRDEDSCIESVEAGSGERTPGFYRGRTAADGCGGEYNSR